MTNTTEKLIMTLEELNASKGRDDGYVTDASEDGVQCYFDAIGVGPLAPNYTGIAYYTPTDYSAEFTEVWATQSKAPYSIYAEYYLVWKDGELAEENLDREKRYFCGGVDCDERFYSWDQKDQHQATCPFYE